MTLRETNPDFGGNLDIKALKTGLIIWSLAFASFESLADEPATNSLAKPYYDCMKIEVEKYSRATDQMSDVITAASASCKDEREKLRGGLIADLLYTKGLPMKDAEQVAKIALDTLDERIRPDLVKAALDSR